MATSSLLSILCHRMPLSPALSPAPATSFPFVKSSCSQPNPLRLPLSLCSIFKLMPGRAWDRRKLTLGRGQPPQCLLKTQALFPALLLFTVQGKRPDLPQPQRAAFEQGLPAPAVLGWGG